MEARDMDNLGFEGNWTSSFGLMDAEIMYINYSSRKYILS